MSTNLSETEHGRKRKPPLKRVRKFQLKFLPAAKAQVRASWENRTPWESKTQGKFVLNGSILSMNCTEGSWKRKETGWGTKEILPLGQVKAWVRGTVDAVGKAASPIIHNLSVIMEVLAENSEYLLNGQILTVHNKLMN